MKPYLQIWLGMLFVPLLLSSCASSPEPEGNRSSLPPWYLSPPQNNQQTLYGVGEAPIRTQAEKQALANLLDRLAVSIQARHSQQLQSETDYREYTQRSVQSEIDTESLKLTINAYQTEQAALTGSDNIAVLLSVPVEQITARLNHEKNSLLLEQRQYMHSYSQLPPLSAWLKGKQLAQKFSDFVDKEIVLQQLENRRFKESAFWQQQREHERAVDLIHNSLNIVVHSDPAANAWQSIVEQSLLEAGLAPGPAKSMMPNTFVNMHSDVYFQGDRGIYIAKADLQLSFTDPNDNLLSSVIHHFNAASSLNRQDAEKKLTASLRALAKQLSPLAFLGLEQP